MTYFKPSPRFVFGGAPRLRDWLKKLPSIHKFNEKDSPIFAADNLITISRVVGFLEEEKFANLANQIFASDELHASIIWRVHVLAWATNHCRNLKGDFIEFGCYDAKVAKFLIEYNELKDFDKTFFLYDIFDNPPTEKGPKVINFKFFKAFSKGYLKEAQSFISKEEINLLSFSGILLALEQAIRFFTDYLNGSIYYKTDYPNQNLDRGLNQIALAKKMMINEKEMENYIQSLSQS